MAVINGTNGNDNLVAPDAAVNDTILAFAGDDRIEARGGDDTILPGLGNDRVEGGDGRDTVEVNFTPADWEVYRYRDEGVIRGPEGTDRLFQVEAVRFTGGGGTIDLNNVNDFFGYSYVASYGDLIGALGADRGKAWAHFRDNGAFEGRKITFDGAAYLEANPDVVQVLGNNADEAGARHYIEYGRNEGRLLSFEPLNYVASYKDLSDAFGPNAVLGAGHYREFGRAEGRQVTFDGLDYVASHADLRIAFGGLGSERAVSDAGARHYIEYGRFEGRATTFDGLQYAAGDADLLLAFRGRGDADSISDAGAYHYITFGVREGRETDGFNERAYAAKNPDLAAAGLTTPDQLALHFLQFGYDEGRQGAYDPVIA